MSFSESSYNDPKNFPFTINQRLSEHDNLTIPSYIKTTQASDVSGCDASKNVLDKSNNIIANTYCGFMSIFKCPDGSGNVTCSYDWRYFGTFIAGIVVIVVALISFVIGIFGGKKSASYRWYGFGVGVALFLFAFFVMIVPPLALFTSYYPSS